MIIKSVPEHKSNAENSSENDYTVFGVKIQAENRMHPKKSAQKKHPWYGAFFTGNRNRICRLGFRIANMTEETQMVLTAANYLDDEAVLNHLPWLTPEEVDEILKRRSSEELARFDVTTEENGENATKNSPKSLTKDE